MKSHIIEMNRFVWIKDFSMVLKITFFTILGLAPLLPDLCPIHSYSLFLTEFSESEVKISWFRRFRNLLGKYRFWISIIDLFLRVIRPSDCDLKFHFEPKMLEYGRKKLFLLRFLQLVFVMTLSKTKKITFWPN